MGLSVKEKAEFVGTFRWIEVRFMELLARWVPTTPEMEVKILFARHVWECAQHADALGKRAFELRAPLHYTLPPVDPFRAWVEEVGALTATTDRLVAFYDVLLPGMSSRYAAYLAATDSLMDEPTVRIVETILHDHSRMLKERDRLLAEVPSLEPSTVSRTPEWKLREASLASVVAHSPGASLFKGAQA